MKKIAEIKIDHIDEVENTQSVDIFFTEDDMEEGTTACVVCLDTGKAFYSDNIYRAYSEVTEAIEEIRKTIEKKAPKIVAVISGGVLQSVIGEAPIDLHVIDYDTDGEDPDDCYEIPQEDGRTDLAYAYIGEIFEEDAKRTKELLTAINR